MKTKYIENIRMPHVTVLPPESPTNQGSRDSYESYFPSDAEPFPRGNCSLNVCVQGTGFQGSTDLRVDLRINGYGASVTVEVAGDRPPDITESVHDALYRHPSDRDHFYRRRPSPKPNRKQHGVIDIYV